MIIVVFSRIFSQFGLKVLICCVLQVLAFEAGRKHKVRVNTISAGNIVLFNRELAFAQHFIFSDSDITVCVRN